MVGYYYKYDPNFSIFLPKKSTQIWMMLFQITLMWLWLLQFTQMFITYANLNEPIPLNPDHSNSTQV